MADFKDVKYGRNPFKFFRGSSLKLFSGSENIESGRYLPWLKKKFQNCYRGQKTRENGRVKDILDLVEKDKSKFFYPDAGKERTAEYMSLKKKNFHKSKAKMIHSNAQSLLLTE